MTVMAIAFFKCIYLTIETNIRYKFFPSVYMFNFFLSLPGKEHLVHLTKSIAVASDKNSTSHLIIVRKLYAKTNQYDF